MLMARAVSRLLAGVAILLLTWTGNAAACPICLSGFEITAGQRIDLADDVVLAVPAGGRDRWRVVAVAKGKLEEGASIFAPGDVGGPARLAMSFDGPAALTRTEIAASDKPLLLVRDRISERWTSLGAVGAQYAPWLRQLVDSRHGEADVSPPQYWPRAAADWSTLSDADWAERISLIAPHLDSPEPLVADIAFGELARAPYSAMRSLAPVLDTSKVRTWVAEEGAARRRAAWILLLGMVGGPDDAMALERRIGEAWASGDATDLSAMLAADLELRGPSRVAAIESMYFADGNRTLAEIEAVLMALRVHGNAAGTIPRARIVDAFCAFIRARPQMAAFVAWDLADWQAWEATADYLAVLRSDAVKDAAGRFAIAAFLQQSPDVAAPEGLHILGVEINRGN